MRIDLNNSLSSKLWKGTNDIKHALTRNSITYGRGWDGCENGASGQHHQSTSIIKRLFERMANLKTELHHALLFYKWIECPYLSSCSQQLLCEPYGRRISQVVRSCLICHTPQCNRLSC